MIARVRFFDNYGPSKIYDYRVMDGMDIKAGDIAVVQTGRSCSVASVVGLTTESARATSYVIQVVSDEAIKRAELLRERDEMLEGI